MYADVVFRAGADEAPVIAVPISAVIDSGTRQIVLVAKGEGRFEPRAVKLGRRGDGYRRGARRRAPRRGGRHRGHLPDRRRKQSAGRAQAFTAAGGAEMIAASSAGRRATCLLVGFAAVFLTLAGLYAVSRVPLDAIPDLSDVQVIVYTEYPGQAPQVVEDQVTYPLTTAMLSVPKSQVVRGFSFFGVSFVYVIFEDGTDLYWARSRVLEYLNSAAAPAAGRRRAEPRAGRDRRRLGLSVCRARRAKEPRRAAHHPGLVHPLRPRQGRGRRRGRERRRLRQAVQRGDRSAPAAGARHSARRRFATRCAPAIIDVGGRTVELAETEFVVRGRGYIKSLADLEQIVVKTDRGVPVLLRDVARVELAPDERRGITELNGEGEVGHRHRAAALRRERARRHPQRQGTARRDRAEPAAGRHHRRGL